MKAISPKYLFLFILLITGYKTQAQTLAWQTTTRQSKPFVFMENKGQLADEKGKVLTDIQYYASQNGVNIYCKKDRIAFVFTRVSGYPASHKDLTNFKNLSNLSKLEESVEQPLPAIASATVGARMEMQFLNANTDVQTISEMPDAYYENYYLAHCPNGITANGFNKLTYKNIWPNIDLVLQTNPGKKQGIEYSFIVNPGGNVKDIQIQWNGADSINMDAENGGIRYANSLGSINESGLKSYQEGSEKAVDGRYVLEDNKVGFEVGGYDKSQKLVIDPTLEWGTYFGGGDHDRAFSVANDGLGNVYIAGGTYSKSAIATSGAFQTSTDKTAYQDAFLAKFSSMGVLKWATYFGGNFEDQANAIALADSGNSIYMTGFTGSEGLATSGAYQNSHGGMTASGSYDAFLTRFNSSGQLNWATYYGGSGYDFGNVLNIDIKGNIYICGQTQSDSGIATSGAYQTSGNYPVYFVFLAKFNNSGGLLWATYFGGKTHNYGAAVYSDPIGNVYITGDTYSDANISSSGAYKTSYSGNADAFLAKFTDSGKRLWATYFGGGGDDFPNGIYLDAENNIFITGYTNSTSGISTSGAYQVSATYGGYNNYDAFLAKFSNKGSLTWATYVGGEKEDYACGISGDAAGNVFVTGYTTSSTNIASGRATQSKLGGLEDVFITEFSNSGSRLWSTYYGGGNYDLGTSLCCDTSGNIYVTGYTASTSGIATSGAYKTSWSGGYDAFLSKFHYKIKYDAGINEIQNPNRNFCASAKSIQVKLQNYGESELDSVKINWTINGKTQNQYNWKGNLLPDSSTLVTLGNYNFKPGVDSIKSWTSLPDGFKDSIPENDTSMVIDTVYSFPKPNVGGNHSICMGDSIVIGSDSIKGHNYLWSSLPIGFTSNLNKVIIKPDSSRIYYLTESIIGAGCPVRDSAKIFVNAGPTPKSGNNQLICEGATLNLGASPISGHSYIWKSIPIGFSDTTSNPVVKPKTTTTFYLTETIQSTGCSKTDSVTISVNPAPKAITGPNQTICPGTQINLGDSAIAGHTYSWTSRTTGFTASQSNLAFTPVESRWFFLKETITTTGCSKTDSVKIIVLPDIKGQAGGNQTICQGSSIVLGAKLSPLGSASWQSNPPGFSSGFTSIIVQPSVTTTYFLTYKKGCTFHDSAIITVIPKLSLTDHNFNICAGTQIQAGTSAIPGYTYSWISKPAGFTATTSFLTFQPKISGTYFLTQKNDSSGCISTDSIQIKINPLPTPHAGKRQAFCLGSHLIKLGDSTNILSDQFQWTSVPPGFHSTLTQTSDTPRVSTWYFLTETNPATGCQAKDSVVAAVYQKPTAFIFGPKKICNNDSQVYNDFNTTGSHWEWKVTGADFKYDTDSSKIIVKPDSKPYTVLLKVTNFFGCSVNVSKSVEVYQSPGAHFRILSDSLLYKIRATDTSAQYYFWRIGDSVIMNPYFISYNYPFDKDSLIKVSLQVTSFSGCDSTFDTIIKFRYRIPEKFNIQVFPNPFSDQVHVKIDLEKAAHIQIVVFDALGRLIGRMVDADQPIGKRTYTLNSNDHHIAAGVYFLKIMVDGTVYVRPVVKVE